MSLEQRCQQFHEAALGTGKSKGPAKEIATLRKFLHKNQSNRFPEKAVSRLFDSIQIYVKSSIEVDWKEGLLEDALKMPYTVFGTKQKKAMLKWLEEVRGGNGDTTCNSGSKRVLSWIDVSDDDRKATLMDEETGEIIEKVQLPAGELGTELLSRFQSTDGVLNVRVMQNAEGTFILGLEEI